MDAQDRLQSGGEFPQRALVIFVEWAVGAATCLLTAIVFLQVLFRYTLETPLGWSEECAMFLFQWCSFLGGALAVHYGTHFHLDILLRRLPAKTRSTVGILGCACVFVTGYVMVRYGIAMMNMNWVQVYPCLGISVAYGYLAIPFSGALMILFEIAKCKGHLSSLIRR